MKGMKVGREEEHREREKKRREEAKRRIVEIGNIKGEEFCVIRMEKNERGEKR